MAKIVACPWCEIKNELYPTGLDHSFHFYENGQRVGLPILFETMIFGGEHDQYQDRYATRDEALEGHKKALAMAKGELETA
jgi:hypothetical protein